MSSLFEAEPESVAELRRYVHDWLKKATKAVESFHNPTKNSFWRDSSEYRESIQSNNVNPNRFNATTTARCYMALAYADRCLRESGDENYPDWANWFGDFFKNSPRPFRKKKNRNGIFASGESSALNNFDIAHLADFWFVAKYLTRFFPDHKCAVSSKPIEVIAEKLLFNFSEETGKPVKEQGTHIVRENGQIAFENVNGEWVGHHFFVTLHSLRALSIYDWEIELRDRTEDRSDARLDPVRQFCIEQCFYVERGIRHLQDIVGLAFAGTIYCLYARQVSDDLCKAIIDALAVAQQENGSWPTAHPIFRGGHRPWHITSHEVALCLTWLYFQPRVPDAARPTLLTMMERYFRKWVIPTYSQIPKTPLGEERFSGWLDDHTMSSDFVVGWATAIVCHFLANYNYVLSDFLNRRVIESLGLQSTSSDYLIDINAHARSKRWSRSAEGVPRTCQPFKSIDDKESENHGDEQDAGNSDSAPKRIIRATWFDLPPFAWRRKPEATEIAERIRWHWTDPSHGEQHHSDKLAERVLLPVLENPGERPKKSLCAGMLPGDPGTRKTSLVKTLGKIIEWPVVTVPASVIFERGFDSMETRASEVFRRLSFLTGCIIFFDEFEEFFRDRGERLDPKQPDVAMDAGSQKETTKAKESTAPEEPQSLLSAQIHDRTIAAFTTPAMLPRLQDLHDVDRCLIFFATNHPEKVDWAIKRPGRFDFRLVINHPRRARILSYLDCPSGRAYEDVGIEIDNEKLSPKGDGQNKYAEICGPVKEAVTKVFTNDTDVIRFIFVEAALRKVAAEVAGGKIDASKLTEIAEKSLTESLELDKKSRNEPPEL